MISGDPPVLRQCWTFSEKLLIEDGIILKGECIIISTSMRPDMLNHLHSSQQGLEKYTLHARNIIYWPGNEKMNTNR